MSDIRVKIEKYRMQLREIQAKLDEALDALLDEDEYFTFENLCNLIADKFIEYRYEWVQDMSAAYINCDNEESAQEIRNLAEKSLKQKSQGKLSLESDRDDKKLITTIDYEIELSEKEELLLSKFGCSLQKWKGDFYDPSCYYFNRG